MSRIDVTELLTDPDFVDQMQVISRVPQINSLGENSLVETTKDTVGSIQPSSGKEVQRLPEALRISNVMTFWFKGEIVTSEPGKYTDVLVFKGKRFQVLMVYDWTQWGAGWSEGVCVAEVPAP